jgi:hypothetical protein
MTSSDVAAARTDRFLYWPTLLAVAWLTLLVWPDSFVLSSLYLDSPFVLLYWLISAGAGVIACIAWVCERAWRRLLSTVILPLSILIVGFNLASVWRAKHYVEFYVMHSSDHDAISTQPKD